MASGFQDHFSSIASRYADFRPHYPQPLFEFLATLAPRTSLVWDCAAGNGQATVDLAQRFERVISTDASAEQIASAAKRPNIEYRVAVSHESGLPYHSINLLTVAQALHWFDFDKFWAEVKRVLTGDGIIAVWAYGINQVGGERANEIVQDFYANVVGAYWPPERKLVEQAYRTIPFPFEEIVAPAFRMEEQWTLEQLIGYFSTWSATNRYIKAVGENPLQPLSESLAAVWGDPATPRRITWPLAMRIGRRPRDSS